MNAHEDDRSSTAKAIAWAHRITSTAIMMVIPGLLGYIVDQYLGTVILFTSLGFLFGMTCAGWQLFKIVESMNASGQKRVGSGNRENDSENGNKVGSEVGSKIDNVQPQGEIKEQN